MTRTGAPHRVATLAYAGAQILDITGPLEVFSRAARWLRDEGKTAELAYSVEIVAERAGPVRMSSGLELVARRSFRQLKHIDTLLVAGGIGYAEACDNVELIAWLQRQQPRVKRMASICTGALILARAGLLRGRRATTHWHYCDALRGADAGVEVDPDAIYVQQGNLYTSAGVTAGMDLALALVEEDWGRGTALAVAQALVMYMKRPGGQSQFSSLMAAQQSPSDPFRELQIWIHGQLHDDLSVERLAARLAMSPRNFARTFVREVGETPAKYVERVRLEAARRELSESRRSIDQIAVRCGFGTAETLRRTFLRHLQITPNDYRHRFRSAIRQ
ncbi:MAG: GlxA family transcriptional regulator [Woeseiaceae bacterium]